MGKLRELEIRYDRPSVYAGGLLTGKVCFTLRDPCKLRDLCVWVEGQTKVTLPGESSNERWLLKNELTLAPYLMQYDFRLPKGLHEVPFASPVPPFLPSSFGDKHGYVYYCCRAIVGNGVGRVHKPFTLIGVEDLNWHPYAAMPVTIKEYGCKSFWSFGRQTGSVQVLLTLDRSGYIPGETIDINAEIINNSKKKLKSSVVQLRQGVLYKTSGGRTKETFQIVADLQHGAIQPGVMDQWEREPLCIPPVPPSFLRGSENISLKYELVFTVPDAAITLVVPVIIGTLPYHPENMRRVMKALPWHTEPTPECIYGANRSLACPQQMPMMMPPGPQAHLMRQAPAMGQQQFYGNGHHDENAFGLPDHRDENRGPPSAGYVSEEEEDDENNNYSYQNGHKQSQYDNHRQQQQPNMQSRAQAKLRENGQQQQHHNNEEIYNAKNKNCFYYNEDNRFLKIEELD